MTIAVMAFWPDGVHGLNSLGKLDTATVTVPPFWTAIAFFGRIVVEDEFAPVSEAVHPAPMSATSARTAARRRLSPTAGRR
jgi:hypothetical protein